MPFRFSKGAQVFWRIAAFTVAGSLAAAFPAGAQSTADSSAPLAIGSADRAALLTRLREGGAIIVIRHAATDRSRPDDETIALENCATQRNLSATGRADSLAIGQTIRELRIPIGAVLTGVYCRTIETGDLAFGKANPTPELDGRVVWPPDEQSRSVAGNLLRELMREQAPGSGEPNVVMIVHQLFPEGLDGAVLDEGDAAIYALDGEDIVRLGVLDPQGWAALSADRANASVDLAAIVERVLRSVVSVEIDAESGAVAGPGFRIGVPHMVVTNAHFLGDTDAVSVVLPDGSRRPAWVLGRSKNFDIAVLELDDTGLPALHSGSGLADLRQGDRVLAVGAMLGLPGTATPGAVLSLSRPVQLPGGIELNALEVEAALGTGHVGGPLVDRQGLVAGLNAVTATPTVGGQADGSGYAIPIDIVKREALAIIADR